jgi:DNA polymerase V
MTAFIHTNFFKEVPQYFADASVTFPAGTNDAIKIIRGAHEILDKLYRPGFGYKKAGVLLNHIVPKNQKQMDIFDVDPSDNEKLNGVIDLINKKYGPYTVKSAACGIKHSWKTVHDYRSQHYTTNWNELLRVKVR